MSPLRKESTPANAAVTTNETSSSTKTHPAKNSAAENSEAQLPNKTVVVGKGQSTPANAAVTTEQTSTTKTHPGESSTAENSATRLPIDTDTVLTEQQSTPAAAHPMENPGTVQKERTPDTAEADFHKSANNSQPRLDIVDKDAFEMSLKFKAMRQDLLTHKEAAKSYSTRNVSNIVERAGSMQKIIYIHLLLLINLTFAYTPSQPG